MKSADFEIYSTASEKSTRETLQHFEQVRTFFSQTKGKDFTKSETIRIVVFSSKKEYELYRPNEVAAAFYFAGPERDYIVLGETTQDAFPVAIHESVHLVVRRAGLTFPLWLNEGLADLYSTLQPYAGKVAEGGVIAGRYQGLFNEKWLPLATILAVDAKSPYYNEKNKAGSLYSESWALTHMLALGPDYRTGFDKLLAQINGGKPSEEALLEVYGKTLPQIEKDLQQHIRTNMTRAVLFPQKLEKSSGGETADTPPPFDVKLTLADLVDRPGREDEVEKRLTELAAEDASRPEPHIELGYLAWRRGSQADAEKHFAKAFALGSQNPRMLWDYGRMAASEHPSEAIPVLTALLTQDDKVETRILLASLQLSGGHAVEALATLQSVTKVNRENAPRLFKTWAYAQMQAGRTEDALASVKRWTDTSQSPEDREEAERLRQYLASVRPGAKPEAKLAVADAVRDAGVPAPPPLTAGGRTTWPSVTGSFVLLQCDGEKATVVLQASNGKQMFLIDDPKKVLVDGKSDRTLDMTCGPQPSIHVRIEFEPSPEAPAGTSGVVRAMHFGQ